MTPFPLQPSALQLENYFVESLRFDVQGGFDSEDGKCQPDPSDLDWNLESASFEDGRRAYRLTLVLPPSDGRLPYSFEVVLIGFFRVADSFPAEDAQKLSDANAPAVLYGAARELISGVTGRGPSTALCLPSLTFNGIARAEKADDPPNQALPSKKSKNKTLKTATSPTRKRA